MLASTAVFAGLAVPAGADVRCGWDGYSYAGLLGGGPSDGAAATIRALAAPRVAGGHVAAWVGLGGYGAGPGGSNAWIQAGLIAYPDGAVKLYYELTRPGERAQLVPLADAVPGRRYRVEVEETRRGFWRVVVDGRPRTQPVFLRGSHGRWEATATTESWDGNAAVCNAFAFSFRRVEGDDRWTVLQAPGHRVERAPGGFDARVEATAS